MGHTRESIIKEVDDFLANGDPTKPYEQSFAKRRGTNGEYIKIATERIAERLFECLELLNKIPIAERKGTYNVHRDGTTPRPADGRKGEKEEDRMAMELFNKKTLPPLGEVIHYQTPLKDGREDLKG